MNTDKREAYAGLGGTCLKSSTEEAEVVGSLRSRPTWSTKGVPG